VSSPFAGSHTSPDHFAAVDVETTGFDSDRDSIIEIAIVIFGRDGVVDRFTQTVNPNRPLPLDVRRLTGLSEQELSDSPTLDSISLEIRRRIGSLPIVGHNIEFDVKMLHGGGITLANRQLDTYRLSTLLMANMPNYSLTQVAMSLGLEIGETHRALPDTERTAAVFIELLKLVESYDEQTLQQAAKFAQQAGWTEAQLFHAAADRKISGPLFAYDDDSRDLPPEMRFSEPRERLESLQRTGSSNPLDPSSIEVLLSDSGPLPHVLERYESRPAQIRMAVAVAEALESEEELLVEAGTGTGKSLAYLLPAAMYAIDRGERVVVSTDTISLQDQLYGKDLPDVRTVLKESGVTEELRVAVMKGRANYLCLRRWFDHMDDPIEDAADASLRAKILLWLAHTATGDKGELRMNREEEVHWRKFASERGRCSPKRCPYARANQCFLYRARHLAANAHIVIANHSLILSNSAQGFVLPPFERLIIDEAHHLESEATSQFSWSVNGSTLEDPVRALVNPEGVQQGGYFSITSSFLARSSDFNAVKDAPVAREKASLGSGHAVTVFALAGELMSRLGVFLPAPRGGRQSFSDRLRVTDAVRARGAWSELTMIWGQLDSELLQLLDSGRWFLRALDSLSLPDDESNPESRQRDELTLELQSSLEELTIVRMQLLMAFGQDDGTRVFWIERSSVQSIISINGALLDVSELLRQEVFDRVKTTVLTSATLTVDGLFDYIGERLGLLNAKRLPLGSPFDHEKSTLVFVPDDMPDPNHQNFQTTVNTVLLDLLAATEGRALVLFTSHSALQATHRAIRQPLEQQNISVLGQRIDGSFRQIVDQLRNNPGTVVLGTSSYWEGVDIVGPALSLVVIVKLPFPVPSEPVFEARCELSDDPFNELSVPQAVLRFKQGFGRLIRSSTDRGVCAVLDRRIITRRYGQAFLHSLPATSFKVGSTYDLPSTAASWLGTDTSRNESSSISWSEQW